MEAFLEFYNIPIPMWVFEVVITAIYIAIPLWILYKILRKVGMKYVMYQRYFSQPGVFEGQTVTLIEEVRSRYFMPLTKVDVNAFLRIELRLPGYVEEDFVDEDEEEEEDEEELLKKYNQMQRYISRFFLPSFTQVKRSIKITCMKRGFYAVESILLDKRNIEAPAFLYVYPKPLEVDEDNPLVNALQSTVQTQVRLFQDPFSFAGIREYRAGDSFRMINYKATAKTGNVMVNYRDFITSRNIMLYIDFSLLPAPEPMSTKHYEMLMERSLSYAADMVFKAIDQGYNVGFAANCKALGFSANPTHIRFPMQSGYEHYNQMLKEMASIALFEGCSFTWLVKQDIDRIQNADVYIMTCNQERDLDEVSDMLRMKNNSVTIVRL